MTDDATLSDFGVDAGESDDEESDPDSSSESEPNSSDDPESADRTDGAVAVETAAERERDARPNAALSTYAWGDHACGRCGAESERVWRDNGAFVCPDCKEW